MSYEVQDRPYEILGEPAYVVWRERSRYPEEDQVFTVYTTRFNSLGYVIDPRDAYFALKMFVHYKDQAGALGVALSPSRRLPAHIEQDIASAVARGEGRDA